MFDEFAGKKVKMLYRDGEQTKIFYGIFEDGDGFVKIRLRDGTPMLINKSEVLKIILKEGD